jgi:hypothetical protein
MPFFFNDPVSIVSSEGEASFNEPGDSGDLGSVEAWLDQLDGWTSTVKPTVFSSQKAVGNGSRLSGTFYHPGRVLMVGGILATDSPAETETAWNELVRIAFPMNETVRLTHNGPQPKYTDVRVISDVRVTQFMPLGFRFEVDLMSEQSFLYDAAATLSGSAGVVGSSFGGITFPLAFPFTFGGSTSGSGNSVTLTNIGNAPSSPSVTLTGPLDAGWRLENTTTGKYISFSAGVSAGQDLIIDFVTRSATMDGTPITGLIDGAWWEVVPGINTIKLFGNYYPGSSFTITAKSAWR